MTKMQFLDLPNELLSLIFEYMTSADLIQSFSDIKSNRIQLLIQPFITHLDISHENDQWLETYLPDLFKQHNINSIRLRDKQTSFLLEHLLCSHLESMHLFNSDWTTDLLKQVLHYIRLRLKRLSITFTSPHGKGDMACYLFQSDCQLECLNITGRFQFFNANEINTCTRLTHLSIEIEGMPRVFILMKCLPNIQQLKVKFCLERHFIQPTLPLENSTSNTLQHVTFIGCTRYFEHFSHFFATFGSKIEYLMIDINLRYKAVDGKRLEQELLNKMPCLSSLDLIIHSSLTSCDPLNIETFQTSSWEKLNPIVYWYDRNAHQHTIFTWPYKSNQFQHLSNNFLSSCVSNRTVSLYFNRVRLLTLICINPLTMEIFELIKTTFPSVKTLELTNPDNTTLFERESKPKSMTSPFNDELLFNNTFQLPTINRFCLLIRATCDSYTIFRRILHLLPNLISLKMFIGRILYSEIKKFENNDSFVRSALNHIKILQMIPFYHGTNTLNNAEIQELFPNAEISFDYDAN